MKQKHTWYEWEDGIQEAGWDSCEDEECDEEEDEDDTA